MSSSETGDPRPDDERGDAEVTAPDPDANVESTPADPGVTDPGPAAADRDPVPAPGAPGELTSDQDQPGQSPDGTTEGDEAPEVTETSGPAADDVPVVAEAVEGARTPEAPEGGDTAADEVEAPATTTGDEPGAAVADQPEPAAAPPEAETTTGATAEPAVAEPEPQAVDELRQPLLDRLAEHLGDGLVATHVDPGHDITARVTREAWVQAAEVCRDVLGLTYFGFLSAMDWMPSPFGRSEDGGLAAPPAAGDGTFEPGTTGGNTRFQLLARLESPKAPSLGLTLKCDLPSDDLVAPTWTKVFPGADWHERETAEMFGIDFTGHPHLVKLYLPGGFEGYPLRKDFPLLARDVKPWPGLVDVEAMPGEDEPTSEEAEG